MSPVTLSDFSRLAGQAAAADQDAAFLNVSGGELSRTGSLGNLFTTQATRRETLDAFVGALRAEYGDHIADMIDNTAVGAMREAGKPLTARLAQDLTSLAQVEQTRVNAHNQGMVEAFLNGPNLDEALGELQPGASPEDRAVLKERVQNFLTDKAAQGGFHPAILTAAALKTNVGLGFPLFTGLSARHKAALSPNQPGALQDRLRLADMGLSKADVYNFTFLRCSEKLDVMRQIQPEGKLTPATVYQALFKQPPPADLGGGKILEAIETRCGQDKANLLAQRTPEVGELLILAWIPQMMPWEKLASLATRPDTVTLNEAKDFIESQWKGNLSRDRKTVVSYIRRDPPRIHQGEGMPAPAFSFQLDDGQGGTKTERIEVGPNPNSALLSNDADKAHYLARNDNPLSRKLEALCTEICGPDASADQLTRVMFCLTQGSLIPMRHVAALAGAPFDEHSNVSVSLSRQPDGSVRADFASLEEERDARGHFSMSLTIGKDGAMTPTEFELTPPLEIRQQRENEAVTQARNARVDQALTTAAPFRALDDSPDGLFAQIRGRALALDPEARLDPKLWENMDSDLGRRVTTMARESAQPLTQEQILAVRADVVNEFFDRVQQTAAQVPAEQRAAFTRGCLELGIAPDPALLPAMAQMAGSVADVFGAILDAKDGNEVRQLLSGLELSMRSATTLNPDFAGKGPGFFTPAHLLAMRMGTLNLMGKDNPQAFARALTWPGPFRDALHSVGSKPTEENGHIRQAINWFNGGMARILPDETLTETLNPHEVRERDLSLPRQREILGEGTYVARGAENAPELAGLNQSLRRDMPAIREHIRASAETDLRLGPTGGRTALGLSNQFAVKDYSRGGIFVDGRYYNSNPPTQRVGTGTSEQGFIDLFPDAHTAGALSNLAGQNLYGFLHYAMGAGVAPETAEMLTQSFFGSEDMQGGPRAQSVRIETLDADQGRYRLTAFLGASSSNPDSTIESFRYELALDVNVGAPVIEGPRPQPTVEDVRLDVLFRGREAVPGEP